MPRYFFHIRDSAVVQDREGTELPDLRTARAEAIHTAGAILRENPDSLWAGQPWHMDVTDGSGRLLFTLDFALRQPPEGSAVTEGPSGCISDNGKY